MANIVYPENIRELAELLPHSGPAIGLSGTGSNPYFSDVGNMTVFSLFKYVEADPDWKMEAVRLFLSHVKGRTAVAINGFELCEFNMSEFFSDSIDFLCLAGNSIGDEGAEGIARLSGLSRLDLMRNKVGGAGARAIGANLKKLVRLNLRGNSIGDEGAEGIARLRGLSRLDLTDNKVGGAGARAIGANLKKLAQLELRGNSIGDEGAEAIARLRGLLGLDLSSNGLGDAGAASIGLRLPHLVRLNMADNNIGAVGVTELAKLSKLRSLDLSFNGIGDEGAVAICLKLPRLTTLNLSGNGVGDPGATAIGEVLTKLRYLTLDNSAISFVGATAIAKLTGLSFLDLANNIVGDAGTVAIGSNLTNLVGLDLSSNGVGDAGAAAIGENLAKLGSLDLANNSIGDAGAAALVSRPTSLSNLTILSLMNNRIGDSGAIAILDWLDSRSLNLLRLNGNPGFDSPIFKELSNLNSGTQIAAAYRRIRDSRPEEIAPFGEAKLIVLGDESVGKTSLVNALVMNAGCDPQQQKTRGVNHQIWQTEWMLNGERSGQLNIWDFGGQEITQQTHTYFLSEGCIYLVVIGRRKEDDNRIYTWLRTIQERAPESPIIVLVNMADWGPHQLQIDFSNLQTRFPQICAVLETSCAIETDPLSPNLESTMPPLREKIRELFLTDARLASAREPRPKAWLRVRDDIRALADDKQVLLGAEFVTVCMNSNDPTLRIEDINEQSAVLEMLHQTGVVVAHGLTSATERLSPLTLLDPNWLTDAVYVLLHSVEVAANNGVFDKALLTKLLGQHQTRSLQYTEKRIGLVLDLLLDQQLNLCVKLHSDQYLLAEALPSRAMVRADDWGQDVLRFRFRYHDLKRGLIPQFLVQTHRFVDDNRWWRSGCVLKLEGCAVLVSGDPLGSQINLLVSGPENRRQNALAVVRSEFAIVHERMPETLPEERIPLPDSTEVDESYAHVLKLGRMYGLNHKYLPVGGLREYSVSELVVGTSRMGFGENDLVQGIRIQDSPGAIIYGADSKVQQAGDGASLQLESPSGAVATSTARGASGNSGESLGGFADRMGIGAGVGAFLGLGGGALYLAGLKKGFPAAELATYAGLSGGIGAFFGLGWALLLNA
jgi:internalin A